jgi:glycosyltransferase involved in cell wall biosynthesis
LWRYWKGFKKAVQSIDLLIAPSEYLRRRLCQSISAKNVTLANFAPLPPCDIPESPYSNYFLFVGRLEEQKGIMNLLELFARIRKKTDAKLLIVGEGDLKDRIEHFIARNSLDGLVSYLGFARGIGLYSLYKGARALIVPSEGLENSPLVALEALSVGTPVIGSYSGGLPEIISKVDRGLIFNSPTELEEIITNFSGKRFPREKIKEIFNMNFSPQIYTTHYLDVIRDIYGA